MITIFVLFVLYTLACIADGPDVKPIWKKWLGKRLEKMANKYYPIQYVQRPMPEIDSPFTRQTIQIQPAETKLIKSNAMFRVFPDIMLGKRAGRGFSDSQVQFSRCIKEGINHILFDIGQASLDTTGTSHYGIPRLKYHTSRGSITLFPDEVMPVGIEELQQFLQEGYKILTDGRYLPPKQTVQMCYNAYGSRVGLSEKWEEVYDDWTKKQ